MDGTIEGAEGKYILVTYINDYWENGGGLQFDRFKTIEELDAFVQEKYNFREILLAGEVREIKYEEVEIVTKVKRIEK